MNSVTGVPMHCTSYTQSLSVKSFNGIDEHPTLCNDEGKACENNIALQDIHNFTFI